MLVNIDRKGIIDVDDVLEFLTQLPMEERDTEWAAWVSVLSAMKVLGIDAWLSLKRRARCPTLARYRHCNWYEQRRG